MIEALRSFLDGRVSAACGAQMKNKVGSAYVIQNAVRIEGSIEKMKWKPLSKWQGFSRMMQLSPNQNAELQWKQQEPFVTWLEQDLFAMILMEN